jgi:hypothetical protein
MSRIAWAKLLARVGEEFSLACPKCGGDIQLISFITDSGPIRKILTHLGEALDPPLVSPARGLPVDWDDLVQAEDDSSFHQATPDNLSVIEFNIANSQRHSFATLTLVAALKAIRKRFEPMAKFTRMSQLSHTLF